VVGLGEPVTPVALALRVWPTRGVPEILALEIPGAAAMLEVPELVAETEVTGLVSVIVTVMELPASLGCTE
jgi:hypothetical protein